MDFLVPRCTESWNKMAERCIIQLQLGCPVLSDTNFLPVCAYPQMTRKAPWILIGYYKHILANGRVRKYEICGKWGLNAYMCLCVLRLCAFVVTKIWKPRDITYKSGFQLLLRLAFGGNWLEWSTTTRYGWAGLCCPAAPQLCLRKGDQVFTTPYDMPLPFVFLAVELK